MNVDKQENKPKKKQRKNETGTDSYNIQWSSSIPKIKSEKERYMYRKVMKVKFQKKCRKNVWIVMMVFKL